MINNSRGQIVVEFILVMIIFIAISLSVANFFKDEEVIKTMVSGPWPILSGMLQNGAWKNPQASMNLHPNSNLRHQSLQGDAH